MRRNRGLVAALAGSAALLVGGGTAALAADGGGHPQHQARCDMRLAKVAQKRGVTTDQLEAQIKARLLARVDALSKAGKISSDRAAALEKRISEASVICPGAHARHPLARRGVRGMLKAAADFLGLDGKALRAQLPGTSLAALAGHRGRARPTSRRRCSRRRRHGSRRRSTPGTHAVARRPGARPPDEARRQAGDEDLPGQVARPSRARETRKARTRGPFSRGEPRLTRSSRGGPR